MILGFTGKMGSGKSTACDIVKEELDKVVHINFKDGLVKELKEKFESTLIQLAIREYGLDAAVFKDRYFDRLFKEKPPIMRALMQNYGTEVRRAEDPEYWVKMWKSAVSYSNHDQHVVTDDVRFLNEAKAIRDFNGKIIRIIRTDITDTGGHQSESEMDKIKAHYTITADKGDHDSIRQQLKKIIDAGLRTD